MRPLAASTKRAASTGLKVAAAGADLLRRVPSGVVVLIYHRVGGLTRSAVDLQTDLFEQQVEELAAAGRIVSIDDAVELLDGITAVDGPPKVVLTFDDGTADWVEGVLPVLERHRAPATFYVATDFVEQGRSFPNDGRPISWSGLAGLVASGLATIGSHTHTHALLDRANGRDTARELDLSVGLLSDRLGVACDHFAYPKALPGAPAAEAEVRARFRTAALAGSRVNRFGGTDLHRLARTPIQVSDGMRWFRRKADGGLRLEDIARAAIDRRRYAGATA